MELLSCLPLNTVFQAVDYPDVSLWVILQGKQIRFKQSNVERTVSENGSPSQSFKAVILNAYAAIGVNVDIAWEDRSLNAVRESHSKENERNEEESPQPSA